MVRSGTSGFLRLRYLLFGLAFGALVSVSIPAQAAVAEFFWAGFRVSDPAFDAGALEGAIYKAVDTKYRSARSGAVVGLLKRLKWDELDYYESAAETGYVKENMRDVYGVFVSVDRIMPFEPNVVDIGGQKKTRYYTYVFATLNVFAADSRNLVFSHPVFLTDAAERPTPPAEILTNTLGAFADELADPANAYTKTIQTRLQDYYGPPGVSLEAIRRTAKPIQAIDDYFADTFGVMKLCGECVGVADKSGMTKPDPVMMGDFARFFMNARLASYRQVAFQPEQAKTVEERTGDVAATAKQGDIARDFSEVCLPEYDETGKSRICVRVAPPRNPVYIGVRALVKPEKGAGSLVKLSFLTVVDIEAEIAGRKEPVVADLKEMGYQIPATQGEKVSNVYYINALSKAINKLDEATIR